MSNELMTDVGFMECPVCKNLAESMLVRKDKKLECIQCKAVFEKEQAVIRVFKKPAVLCKDCNFEVSLTSGNADWGAGNTYICPKCRKVVAFKKQVSGSVVGQ